MLRLAAALALVATASARRTVFFEGSRTHQRGEWTLASDDFAARELTRYVFLSTGQLPDLVDFSARPGALMNFSALAGGGGEAIVLAAPGSALLQSATELLRGEDAAAVTTAANTMDHSAEAGHHTIHALSPRHGGTLALIVGAGEFGRLYGAYSAAEQLGVRFELTGDILPDPTQDGGLPLAACADGSPLPLKI